MEDERDAATIDRYYDLRKEVDEIPQKISDAEEQLDTAQELLDGTHGILTVPSWFGGDPTRFSKRF